MVFLSGNATQEEDLESDVGIERETEIANEPEISIPQEEDKEEVVTEKEKDVTVAWQPSHQDDTGDADWHEYFICNDIVDRAIPLCTNVNNHKCWDISYGLTGTNNYKPSPTNTPAFDSEIAMANSIEAHYFISIHNDGGAPSGILGICMPDDTVSRSFLERFVEVLCMHTGLPNRGIWEVRLYSLEPERNYCPCRILLEIGDNQNDRILLENPDFRQQVAQALAEVVNELPPLR